MRIIIHDGYQVRDLFLISRIYRLSIISNDNTRSIIVKYFMYVDVIVVLAALNNWARMFVLSDILLSLIIYLLPNQYRRCQIGLFLFYWIRIDATYCLTLNIIKWFQKSFRLENLDAYKFRRSKLEKFDTPKIWPSKFTKKSVLFVTKLIG